MTKFLPVRLKAAEEKKKVQFENQGYLACSLIVNRMRNTQGKGED